MQFYILRSQKIKERLFCMYILQNYNLQQLAQSTTQVSVGIHNEIMRAYKLKMKKTEEKKRF